MKLWFQFLCHYSIEIFAAILGTEYLYVNRKTLVTQIKKKLREPGDKNAIFIVMLDLLIIGMIVGLVFKLIF